MYTQEEEIECFKKDVVSNMERNIAKSGGLQPVVVILAKELSNSENAIFITPIPGELLDTYQTKELLAKFIPRIFDDMFDKGFEPICYSFSSEAWLRKSPKEDGIPDDWRSLPKVESMVTFFETADETSIEVNIIKRDGKIADENGELIDCISLEKDPEFQVKPENLGGRLSNIFRDYMNNKNKKDEHLN